MKNMLRILLLALFLFGSRATAAPIDFWDVPRHGANSFNRLPPDQAYFDALANYGADWVRLAFAKWKGTGRDFLIGDADRYAGLPPEDLATLKAVLARADRARLKVVVTPLSLPWDRWSQHNGDKPDNRLWEDKARWADAARFWRDLAAQLRGNPAVGAYNIINEPTPERSFGLPEHSAAEVQHIWYQANRGTARDLLDFYRIVIAAIRSVDPDTPIMLDAGWYAAADAFSYWPAPLDDPALLYAYHMYEPWSATSGPNIKRAKPWQYPGIVPFADGQSRWDAARVREYLALPLAWADAHGIPRTRMVAAEFGCMRRLPFCRAYLEDVLDALDEGGVHWAFYAFRTDEWDGMDYELGSGPVGWRFWEAIDKGAPDPAPRAAGPEFTPILRRLKPRAPQAKGGTLD